MSGRPGGRALSAVAAALLALAACGAPASPSVPQAGPSPVAAVSAAGTAVSAAPAVAATSTSQPATGAASATAAPFAATSSPTATETPITAAPTAGATATPAAAAAGSPPRRIILIVMESKERDEVIGSADAPYFNGLAARFAQAERYHALREYSVPNFLALLSGHTFGVLDNCTDCLFDEPNLADQLEATGMSWGGYFEDLPEPCFLGEEHEGYRLKHNPFLYFRAIRDDPARCARVMPLSRLAEDLAAEALPHFSLVIPNMCHSTHDCPLAEGDEWLASVVPTILASAAWKAGGTLVITWDEGTTDRGCCGQEGGGRVPFVAASPSGPFGFRSRTQYTHYSLLRSIQDAWSLPPLGHAGDAETRPMADLFPPAAPD